MNKLTKREALMIARDVVNFTNINGYLDCKADWTYDDVVEKLNAMIEMLDKQSSRKSVPKNKAENDSIKNDIIKCLKEASKEMKASEIADELGISTQKASALVNQLAKNGLVQKIELNKKSSVFMAIDEKES